MNLQNIAALHRASVGLVFSRYGINAPVTADTIHSAVIVHKEPFINDLQIAVDGNFAYDTNEGEKTKGQKIADALKNVLAIAAGTFGAYHAGKQLVNSPTNNPNNQTTKQQMDKKNMQTFIIGVSAVIVAVLLFVAITRLKEKTAK